MIRLIEFFAGSAGRIQFLIVAAGIVAASGVGLLGYGLWWRGEAYEARSKAAVAEAQVSVLTDTVKRCNDSVDAAKRSGDAALALGRDLLTHARSLSSGSTASIARLEDLIKKSPAGAGCDAAWAAIEAERKARAP